MKFIILVIITFISLAASASNLRLGEVPPLIMLNDELGGRTTGENWDSRELKGKILVLFYVDPDEKELNSHVADALAAEKFPLDKYGSLAVINMAATWKPNFVLSSILQSKQEKFPNTVYVKDLDKVLVKVWGLKDDSSHILAFDKKGRVIFDRGGKLSKLEMNTLVGLIRKEVNR